MLVSANIAARSMVGHMQQLHLFFNAWVFYTRFPAPAWVVHSSENLNQASRYFPLIGACLAVWFAAVYSLASFYLPNSVSLLLAIVASLLATGAFHEDGFADLCDGFGGGWHRDDVLRIMKDSRLGTYGVAGLWGILTLKAALLYELIQHTPNLFESGLPLLVSAFMLSRAWSISLVAVLPYVQQDAQSKAKPIAVGIRRSDLIILWATSLLPLYWFSLTSAIALLVTGGVFFLLIRAWFNRRLQGYTGDALGASQQIQELVAYMAMLVMVPL